MATKNPSRSWLGTLATMTWCHGIQLRGEARQRLTVVWGLHLPRVVVCFVHHGKRGDENRTRRGQREVRDGDNGRCGRVGAENVRFQSNRPGVGFNLDDTGILLIFQCHVYTQWNHVVCISLEGFSANHLIVRGYFHIAFVWFMQSIVSWCTTVSPFSSLCTNLILLCKLMYPGC
jgi:hypothetical protein